MQTVEAVRWAPDGAVRIIDQRRLPSALVERDLRTVAQVCEAIATLAVRGAPAIGVAGAMGLAAAMRPFQGRGSALFARRMEEAAARIRAVRPTAVNLAWAVDRTLARGRLSLGAGPAAAVQALHDEADAILREDRAMCRRIGEHGMALIPDGARVLTHCNAGALATSGIGTALAPIYAAVEAGRRVEVFADETRPLLQGSRLTAWELDRAGIPVTVLTDSMAASLMRAGRVDLCIVGADRIAANGDVANKIGTYPLAIVARHHGVPFYVAAPASTFDAAVASGAAIEIEERAAAEVTGPKGRRTAPEDVRVYNPAFDVTPASLVSAIVSDRGVHLPPYDFGAGVGGPPRDHDGGEAADAPHRNDSSGIEPTRASGRDTGGPPRNQDADETPVERHRNRAGRSEPPRDDSSGGGAPPRPHHASAAREPRDHSAAGRRIAVPAGESASEERRS